jgi:Secretion system C-terminal sorting domain
MIQNKTMLVLIILLLATTVQAFPRKVLFEEFTNADCGPCAQNAPTIENFINENIEDIAIVITHVDWPGFDPWNQDASEEAAFRTEYYGVIGVPAAFLDGSSSEISEIDLQNNFDNAVEEVSPVEIDIVVYDNGDQIISTAIVVNSGDTEISGNYKLRVALIEIHRTYEAPNGQTEWHYGLLEMTPDASGLDFSLVPNSSYSYSHDFDLGFYDLDNIVVTAWIQNDNNQDVIQAEMSPLTKPIDLDVTVVESTGLLNAGSTKEYSFDIENTGFNQETYSIEVETDFPDGWDYTYITSDGEQSGNSSIVLDAMENSNITLSVNSSPEMDGVDGTIRFNISSTTDPQVSSEVEFYTMTSGNILVVNGDVDPAISDFYDNAIVSALDENESRTFSIWNSSEWLFPSNDISIQENLELVVWNTGDDGNLNIGDISILEGYLNDGGNLFISGSGSSDQISSTTLIEMMGASFHSSYPSGINITGVNNDPISDGMSFSIEGGDGADNRGVPSSMTSSSGEVCFKYTPLRFAGIRHETEVYKTLLLGFPFEAIDSEDSRNEFMLNSLEYLIDLSSSSLLDNGDEEYHPTQFILKQNYPNPFNPDTQIGFTVPEKADIELTIYDLLGSEITRISFGELSAGNHSINWQASNIASGIYFYRISAKGQHQTYSQTKKMMFLK